jgi:hypothetical protein
MIDTDDVGLSLSPSTHFPRLGKKCHTPTDPPVSAIARA